MKLKLKKMKLPLPDRIRIKDGELVSWDGSPIDFSALPDGKYSLIQTEVLEQIFRNSEMLKGFAG